MSAAGRKALKNFRFAVVPMLAPPWALRGSAAVTEGRSLQSLADDIREHGLKEPITPFEGKILDGRNRHRASELALGAAGIQAIRRHEAGALTRSGSINRKRRHLNSSQAAVAEIKRAELCAEYGAEVDRLRAAAAEKVGGRPKTRSGARAPR